MTGGLPSLPSKSRESVLILPIRLFGLILCMTLALCDSDGFCGRFLNLAILRQAR